MRFHILTLFPDMVEQGLHTSIIGRAVEKGLLAIEAVNIRDYTVDKHKKVDDYPYGGGAGVVMQAQPIYDAYFCGHYEGVDERVLEEIVTDYISIGDYVLTGGELPAMVLVDAISRMVPGVLKNQESGETESLEGNLLEYPQYSRPEVWREKAVPPILLSGNHQKVDEWRREQSILRTKERRPDLFERAELSEKERKIYGNE